jgi:hypothetical protein
MITSLYSLSDLAIVILFGLAIALAFMAAPLLRHKLFGEVSDSVSDFARATMTPITGFTGVVLAFSLVQAQGNLRNVQKTVSMEALQLNQLDRLAISYGPELTPVRQAARDYAQSVVSDEWFRLAKHSYSPRSTELFRLLSQRVLSIQPTAARENVIYSDLVRMTDQLAESRQERLAESELALPPIFWEVIGSLTILLIIFAGFVNERHAMSLGGLGAGVALLISLVFIFDQPFLGDSSVRPNAILNTIQMMNARSSAAGSS